MIEDIPNQQSLFDENGEANEVTPDVEGQEHGERALLDTLLEDSRLYQSGQDYKDLLDTVSRLRNVAPFNAMLLDIQKPGITYVASEFDWKGRFNRGLSNDVRPLVVLRQFGPVAFVYDVLDTYDIANPTDKAIPENLTTFFATGPITKLEMDLFTYKLARKKIDLVFVDQGDAKAGQISKVTEKSDFKYQVKVNRSHSPAVQFSTLTHELGHLVLGHLGPDKDLSIPKRRSLSEAQEEIEAESVAYVACMRNGVKVRSQKYLSNYVGKEFIKESVDLYQVMRSAGRVESLLGLIKHTKFEGPGKKKSVLSEASKSPSASQTFIYRDFKVTVIKTDENKVISTITLVTQLYAHERIVRLHLAEFLTENDFVKEVGVSCDQWRRKYSDDRSAEDIANDLRRAAMAWYS